MAHQLADLSGAQEKDQHRPGPGEGRGVFALRYGRSSGRPREDDALAHIGAGEFAAERRCCREHAADARDDGCGHAFLGQPPDLLVDRAVHGGIAGVQAHDTFPARAASLMASICSPRFMEALSRQVQLALQALRWAGLTSEPA